MTRAQLAILVATTALLLCIPLLGSNYVLRLATIMLMYSTLAMAWNFIGGFAGYPSFGLAAFFGLGAYAGAITQSANIQIGLAWATALIVGGGFALIMGLILLRLRGHAFAIATLVIAEVLRELTNGLTGLTGGGMGINLPFFGWSPELMSRFFFYVMFSLAALTLLITYAVGNSRFGFGLTCIRQNEDAANIVGVNTLRYKVAAFTLSGAIAAITGAVYSSWTGYIEPADVYDILFSIKPILMVLLGGMGTVFGPIIGATAFLILDEIVWRNFLEMHTGLLGLVIVILVLFLPSGLISFDIRSYFRKKVRT